VRDRVGTSSVRSASRTSSTGTPSFPPSPPNGSKSRSMPSTCSRARATQCCIRPRRRTIRCS